ncbi:hypothetical protein BDV32DRAFT_148117 [Aspergillus pseudonomiae]|uniref:Uncharacterized protein n=1 Tax=Aspergillus pseudonomiae TaxID=1506151 RepID=A0A5N7D9Y1_9EURO|nr:uncharacterized protein BDV37DRAFT_283879 [Aspergillus pseudonomiae]KAB8261795.1 hypothetical protein BDV32DRAFT_148117 [Aspergillus pseudonomiae]KAE8403272.1 hypothetical protein BDV37DRAFT_283879 [Aspergillus pseudonomiae]
MRLTHSLILLSTFALLPAAWPTMHQRRSILARGDEPPTLNGLVKEYDKLSPAEINMLLPRLCHKEHEKLHGCVASQDACAGHLHDLAKHAQELGLLKSFDNSH